MSTVIEHLVSVGISEERAREQLRGGLVRVGQEIVADPDAEIPAGAKVVLQPGSVTEEV